MNKKELILKINKLKKDRNAVLLVHNYQRSDIQEIADILGDSLDLARRAVEVDAETIVFCGVRFMAETAKILSPDKMVLLPQSDAGCPMADMVTVDDVRELRKKHPKAAVVSYVNSSAEVKAEVDVCCTSSNALEVVTNIESDEIIFVPDRNLASYCQRFTKKKIILWAGHCYVHARITADEVLKAQKAMPDAVLLVHPECNPDVVDLADEVLSTNGMMSFVKNSQKKAFLIATEEGLIHRLKRENPGRHFYAAGSVKTCFNMKKITLQDIYLSLLKEKTQVVLSDKVSKAAKKALEQMIRYG